MRDITILGSTGSIGRQALSVLDMHRDKFRVAALTAHQNAELLFAQVRAFRPVMAGLTGGEAPIPDDLKFCDWRFGADALDIAARDVSAGDVLAAVVGVAGLRGVLLARQSGKRVLLANKETLVAGGELVMRACPEGTLVPVDSEHSAIYQCLRAAGCPPEKLLLTASGGPFRTWSREQIERATPEQALAHPNWSMGRKVTIDSASMFNKALEIIEAKWLFSVAPEQIEVLIHPQSVVHSMVQFKDGAVLAQLGVPDMRVPIAYALSVPDRLETGVPAPDFAAMAGLTFEAPDPARFPALGMAYAALKAGGAAACVLNAANEEAVARFLAGDMPFGDIARVVHSALDAVGCLPARSLSDIMEADARARSAACQYMEKRRRRI